MSEQIVNTPAPETAAPPVAAPAEQAPASPAPEAPKNDAPAAEPAKPAEELKKEEPAKPATPEKYDLKLSDGSKLPASRIEEVAAYAKEKGLSQEAAQELLATEEKAVSSYHEREMAAYQQRQNEWQTAVKNDPEMGGENYNQTLVLANRVIERHGSAKLKADLQSTGLGNHPELVRIFAAIGKGMADDTFVQPGTQVRSTDDLAEKFYGKK